MTVFRTATLRTFLFAMHAGVKVLKKTKFVDLNQYLQKIEIETESNRNDIPAAES